MMQLVRHGSRPDGEHPRAEVVSHETIHHIRVNAVDVGTAGFVEAGTLLEWIDTAAHRTAVQWCARDCATASVGNIHLDRPIGVGEIVDLRATLSYTDGSSMHILITLISRDPDRATTSQCAQCAMTIVAFDSAGEPVTVPDWTPVTMLELQRQRQARLRIRVRRNIEDAMEAQTYTTEGGAPSATVRFRAASTDANSDGRVRGGRLMRWVDEAAYVCGAEWTHTDVVTSYVAGIFVRQPVYVSDVVDVRARVIHTGPRSVHIGVRVVSAPDQRLVLAQGVVVVVSLGERGEARPVDRWHPETDEDTRLDRHARHLIALRQHLEPFSAFALAGG